MARRAIASVQTASAPLVSQPHYAVQVWEGDVPSVEKFLKEVVKEKLVRFTAQQLCAFASNYSTRLGFGGFGVVYKEQFPNGVKIAVKVLERSSARAAGDQFMAEVGTIGKTYHMNLVRLYGFCHDHFVSALVYEFMENGSFDKYLFREKEMIEWNVRDRKEKK
ncbi:hypothetical protein SLEP1_g45808 [Rubroshorea leprosula]|uniref:Protein kinase domain-containing protein n=1 Tax=Rubroshorea leprosula TaxID=152421 RepID=A0AAV5LKB7_9ROSI|nr:hypothetical protein SLEP1_g45808 [Rubroshorea leprosula]